MASVQADAGDRLHAARKGDVKVFDFDRVGCRHHGTSQQAASWPGATDTRRRLLGAFVEARRAAVGEDAAARNVDEIGQAHP